MRIRRPGKSLLDDPVWIELLERYVRDKTTEALARDYKVIVSAINWQARNRGYRKMDPLTPPQPHNTPAFSGSVSPPGG